MCDNAIGILCGVSNHFAKSVRDQVGTVPTSTPEDGTGAPPPPVKRKGRDGKAYPAKKKRAKKLQAPTSAPEQPPVTTSADIAKTKAAQAKESAFPSNGVGRGGSRSRLSPSPGGAHRITQEAPRGRNVHVPEIGFGDIPAGSRAAPGMVNMHLMAPGPEHRHAGFEQAKTRKTAKHRLFPSIKRQYFCLIMRNMLAMRKTDAGYKPATDILALH